LGYFSRVGFIAIDKGFYYLFNGVHPERFSLKGIKGEVDKKYYAFQPLGKALVSILVVFILFHPVKETD